MSETVKGDLAGGAVVLRYLRNVTLGLFVFVAVCTCGTAIYIGIEDGWKAAFLGTGAIWIGPLILSASLYSQKVKLFLSRVFSKLLSHSCGEPKPEKPESLK